MSNIDLTKAAEELAIWLRLADRDTGGLPWASLTDDHRRPWRSRAQSLLRFVAPHIERQVREQVAREIEDLEHDRDEMRERLAQGLSATWAAGYDNAVHDAARIARGEQP